MILWVKRIDGCPRVPHGRMYRYRYQIDISHRITSLAVMGALISLVPMWQSGLASIVCSAQSELGLLLYVAQLCGGFGAFKRAFIRWPI